MNLGKILKKILPVAETAGQIVVNDNVAKTQAAVFLRQALMVGGTYMASKGIIGDGDVDVVVGATIALGSVIYGQMKTRKDKKEVVHIANKVADKVAVVQ